MAPQEGQTDASAEGLEAEDTLGELRGTASGLAVHGTRSMASLYGEPSALSTAEAAPWGTGAYVHAWVLVLPGRREVCLCASLKSPCDHGQPV